MPRLYRLPTANEKRSAAPDDREACEDELRPNGDMRPEPGEVAAHLQEDQRRGQCETRPETAGHVGELGVRLFRRLRDERFEDHAAEGAWTGLVAQHLRVHRAGPLARFGDRPRGLFGREEAAGLGDEALAAARAAEKIAMAVVLGRVLRRLGVDAHPANRVEHGVLDRHKTSLQSVVATDTRAKFEGRMEIAIGELSRRTACNIETIRYYERIGLLPRAERQGGRFRRYGAEDVGRLRFVRRARQLGFS